jgi:predicted ATP-binding protein involved in virulence
MKEAITHIERVVIKGLWGRKEVNIDWQLNTDINVLSGDNGSGKSTVLRLIGKFLNGGFIEEVFEDFYIIFNNGDKLEFKWGTRTTFDEFKSKTSKEDIKKIRREYEGSVDVGYKCLNGIPIDRTDLDFIKNKINLVIIANAEQPLFEKEVLQKLSNNVYTYLDWEIDKLQRQYANYQINIGKRVIERLESGENDVKKITAPKNSFFNIIDDLFKDTNKIINRERNDIEFIQKGAKITPQQLSSGEKQMLIILLSALVQDNQRTIMIMDEPELSLHPDWQETTISNVIKLNPNTQLIVATHSPFIIINGLMDKVTEMREILTTE